MALDNADMEQHVRIVAILSIVWGALSAIIALVVMAITGLAIAPAAPREGVFIAGVLGVVLLAVLAMAVLAIVAGWGLLNHRPWSRILILVVAALSLFSFPLGTAFGVYTIWVMTRPEVEQMLSPNRGAATT